jgi:hypothetical protein
VKLIELHSKQYEVPENWNELNEKRLLQLVDIMFLKGYRAEVMILNMLRVLAQIPKYQFSKCSPEEISEYLYLCEPYLQEDMEFTKNLVPQFAFKDSKGHVVHFYGPDDCCTNLRMSEFTYLEDLYVRWCQSKREDLNLLNDIVAILYRPAPKDYDLARNPRGDRREPYNDNVCGFNAKKYIALWPPSVKLAIAFWYGGCRTYIVQNYPDLFEASTSDVGEFGLLSVMMSVAESGVFGYFEKVEDTYVNLVLIQLTKVVKEAKRLERENKR